VDQTKPPSQKVKMIVKLWRWLKSKIKNGSQPANNEHSSVERHQLQIYLFKPEPRPSEIYKALLINNQITNRKKKRRSKKR
jgi:hypothetical protein